MKKIAYSIFLLFAILNFNACEGPMGPPGQDGWANIYVQYYTVKSWTLSEDRTFYYVDVDCPQLIRFVYDEGVTMAYIEDNNNVQNPLPWDQYRSDTSNVEEFFWTETISFDITPGSVRFYYEPSDFVTIVTPPQCVFKVALMW